MSLTRQGRLHVMASKIEFERSSRKDDYINSSQMGNISKTSCLQAAKITL
jgi:hypothetical protein